MEIEYPVKNKANSCLECGSIITLFQEKGGSVCKKCGLIINEKNFDLSNNDVRYFNREEMEKKVRTGPPQNSLTDIHHSTRLKINNTSNLDLKRAFRQNNWLEWHQKNLLTAANELKRISSSLRLPDYVRDMSMTLYKRYIKSNVLSGRSINGMIAACLYYVCRKNRISRSLKEISNKTLLKHENKKYDLVIESYTLQVLPKDLRDKAIEKISNFVNENGILLLISRGRGLGDDEGEMPWPLLKEEIFIFEKFGMKIKKFEDYFDNEDPPVRRFRVEIIKT